MGDFTVLHPSIQTETSILTGLVSNLVSRNSSSLSELHLHGISSCNAMENFTNSFQPDTLQEIFKFVWTQTAKRRAKEDPEEIEPEAAGAGSSKKTRGTNINSDALKLSCEYLRLFVVEAVERAALVAEAEGCTKIEGTHLERILPQLLLDF